MDLKNCYIEREHVADDTIGRHLVPENLDTGDYYIDSLSHVPELEDLSMVVSVTVDSQGNDRYGEMYTGVYSGSGYLVSDDYEFINTFLTNLATAGKSDAVNNIFMVPSALVIGGEDYYVSAPTARTIDVNMSKGPGEGGLDGYFPKNNKLYTYPYNFLMVSNNHGMQNIYKYEFFNVSNCPFVVSCDVGPSPTVYLIPKDYKGVAKNYEELMTLTGYPFCDWTTDIYKVWLAQNAVSNAVGVAGSALSLGVGVATMNPIAIASGALGVAGSIGQFYEKSIQPNPLKGSVSGGGNVSQGIQNFTFYNKTVRYEIAKIIDNYFDRYGYKVNELKTPVLKTRTNWNYIKTHEANVSGNIPNRDLGKIHSIFNNGITFWHNDNVGDYSRSNATL
jgi:hypothetical protein